MIEYKLTEPDYFWTNPEGVKLACYEWMPQNQNPKFILYIGWLYINIDMF